MLSESQYLTGVTEFICNKCGKFKYEKVLPYSNDKVITEILYSTDDKELKKMSMDKEYTKVDKYEFLGTMVDDKYLVLEIINESAFTSIYLVRDVKSNVNAP